MLSSRINARGFHVDRQFAEAARRIAQAAAPEIDAELAELTDGAVTGINQIARLTQWLQDQGCTVQTLDRKAVEKLLEQAELPSAVRRVLELRLGGAQAAVKKIDALLARAGDDDRVRGAFRYHGAATGRWAGEGFQPHVAALVANHRVKPQPLGQRVPFRWYETTPMLLQKGAVETLIAMARQADHSLQQEFGLPLGLIVIDTVAACAGYTRAGDENDPAAAQAVMNVLKALAQTLGCFVLGVDHFGKNVEAGTRGASSKESASDLVLACLGDKSLSGSVSNTRLAVRKNRGGQQGQEFPFTLRVVEAPEPDDDGEPITSMVVDWQPNTPGGNQARPGPDPWAQSRRQDQRTAVLRLKRVMMGAMAEHGVEREIPPDGPAARMIDQEVVRGLFYAQTPADGTPKQKTDFRRQQFNRALDWAEAQELIASHEIDDVVYLRLCSHKAEDDNEGG